MRTSIVSTSKLKKYRTIVIIIDALFLLSLIINFIYTYSQGGHWTTFTMPFIIYLQFHIYYGLFLNLKNVSYDDSSIYYDKKGYEVQVPFEDILSIEIKSLTGIYGIRLLHSSQGDKEILFKTSLWYPLNFKKKDEMVNELRDKIDRYKITLPEQHFSVLPSYRL